MKSVLPSAAALMRMQSSVQTPRKPKPYPVGKTSGFPTRILWIVTRKLDGKMRTFYYCGKPSRQQVLKFFHHATMPDLAMATASEYDRGGCIAYCTSLDRWPAGQMTCWPQAWNGPLLKYYHPWTEVAVMAPTFLDFGRKWIKVDGKAHVVYGPKRGVPLKRSQVEAFKNWVREHLDGKKPPPKEFTYNPNSDTTTLNFNIGPLNGVLPR